MQFFDAIYCLTTSSAKDRQEYIKSEFQRVGITKFNFVVAPEKENSEIYKLINTGKTHKSAFCFQCLQTMCQCANNYIMKSQISNWLGFLNIFKLIIEHNQLFTLICEDDVKFTDYSDKVLAELFTPEKFQEYDINLQKPVLIRLGWANNGIEHVDNGFYSFKSVIKMSNCCFAISLSMAKELLSNFATIYHSSDIYIHRHMAPQYNHFTIMPPISYDISNLPNLHITEGINPHFMKDYERELNNSELTVEQRTLLMKKLSHQKTIKNHQTLKPFLLTSTSVRGLIDAMSIFAGKSDIPYNEVGQHGSASVLYAVVANEYPIKQLPDKQYYLYEDYGFLQTLYFIQNPEELILNILNDIVNTQFQEVYDFFQKWIFLTLDIDINQFPSNEERSVAIFVYWHKIIMMRNPDIIIRNENIAFELMHYLYDNKIIEMSEENIKQIPDKEINIPFINSEFLSHIKSNDLVNELKMIYHAHYPNTKQTF
jgi:hypothetical protein